jgi:hypothetical protein
LFVFSPSGWIIPFALFFFLILSLSHSILFPSKGNFLSNKWKSTKRNFIEKSPENNRGSVRLVVLGE